MTSRDYMGTALEMICDCCGRKFLRGVFGGVRCEFCQDQSVYTTSGARTTVHKPCAFKRNKARPVDEKGNSDGNDDTRTNR